MPNARPTALARSRRAARIRLAAPRFAKIPQPDGRADGLARRVQRALARASR